MNHSIQYACASCTICPQFLFYVHMYQPKGVCTYYELIKKHHMHSWKGSKIRRPFLKNAWFTVSIAFFTWQPVMSGCCSLIKQPLEVSTPNSMDLQEKLLYTHFFSSFWKYWSTCPQRSLVFLCFLISFELIYLSFESAQSEVTESAAQTLKPSPSTVKRPPATSLAPLQTSATFRL